VAKHQKTGGRDWKPGESGNPNGRPKLPAEVKEARRLNQLELERVMNKYVHMSMSRLKLKKEDPRTKAVDRMVIGLILKGTKGNVPAGNLIFERLAGKMTTKVEVSRPDQKPVQQQLAGMTDAEFEAYYAQLEQRVKGG
jgi:hypothetical protein